MNTLMMYYQKLASSGQKWKKKKNRDTLFKKKYKIAPRGTCINTFFYVAITREIFVSAAKDGF